MSHSCAIVAVEIYYQRGSVLFAEQQNVCIVESHSPCTWNIIGVTEPLPCEWLNYNLKNNEQLTRKTSCLSNSQCYLSAMERWELLHSVGLVCSTPWSMQWARRDWATQQINRNICYASLSLDLYLGTLGMESQESMYVSLGRAQPKISWQICPSFVLKIRNMKGCPCRTWSTKSSLF